MYQRILLVLAVIFLPLLAEAQKIKDITGEYTYVQADDETLAMAKARAVKNAQNEAIAQEFGTLIMKKSIIRMDEKKMSTLTIGENEVKAQWIKDNRPPEFKFSVDPATGQQIITVKVSFKAREIISKAVQIEAQLLRNGTDLRNEDNIFLSGDQMYLHFKSPVSGFLVVYEQGEDQQVRRLLPYSRSKDIAFPVEGNKDYILFSPRHLYNGESKDNVDEICFSTSQTIEMGRICVIFSTNPIDRPFDKDGGTVSGRDVGIESMGLLQVPRQLSFDDFQTWLSTSRLNDIRMRYQPIDIEIKRR